MTPLEKEADDFANTSGEWLYIKSEDPCSAMKNSYLAGAKVQHNKMIVVLKNCASYLELFRSEWKEGEEMLYYEIKNLIDHEL